MITWTIDNKTFKATYAKRADFEVDCPKYLYSLNGFYTRCSCDKKASYERLEQKYGEMVLHDCVNGFTKRGVSGGSSFQYTYKAVGTLKDGTPVIFKETACNSYVTIYCL